MGAEKGFYPAIAESYNWLHGKEQLEKAVAIKNNMRLHGLLLDIGAGTGIATESFRQECRCIALEPSIEMLKQFNGAKVVGRAEQLPFKEDSFDSVVSLTALHHADLGKAFNEIGRIAKEDAGIAVSFFKRARSFRQAEELFKGFQRIDEKFDTLFLKK